MTYVLVNTETGAYVAPAGRPSSYTRLLQDAKTYPTREAAERDSCPGNERPVSVNAIMGRNVGR